MKKLLGALLFAGIFAMPQSANAQLGSYCGSTDWCFDLTHVEFRHTATEYIYALTGVFSGGAFSGRTGLTAFALFSPVLWAGHFSVYTPFQAGLVVSLHGVTYRSSDDIIPSAQMAPGDLNFMWWDDSSTFFDFGCDGDGGNFPGLDECVYTPALAVVPEPSTWVMMATGLLGVGFVAWRRRAREEEA